jgi:hypothetical protein
MTLDPKAEKTYTTPGLQGRQCAEPFWQSPFARTQRIHPISRLIAHWFKGNVMLHDGKSRLDVAYLRVLMVLEVVNIWGNVCMRRADGIMC